MFEVFDESLNQTSSHQLTTCFTHSHIHPHVSRNLVLCCRNLGHSVSSSLKRCLPTLDQRECCVHGVRVKVFEVFNEGAVVNLYTNQYTHRHIHLLVNQRVLCCGQRLDCYYHDTDISSSAAVHFKSRTK